MRLPVFGVKPWSEWDQAANKPGRHLGTNYSVLKIKNRGPVIVNVKVPGEPVVTDTSIRDNFKAQTIIWVDFADYEEDMYVRNGVTYHTATATAVSLVDDDLDVDIG